MLGEADSPLFDMTPDELVQGPGLLGPLNEHPENARVLVSSDARCVQQGRITTVGFSDGIASSIVRKPKVHLRRVEIVKPKWQSIVLNVPNIRLGPNQCTNGRYTSIPESMEIVGHETKEINIWLHALGVHPPKVPVIRC